mgnify:CR=1
MNLTEQTNDTVEQAMRLLSPVDMSDWSPPEGADAKAAEKAYQEEEDRRVNARLDEYLADRNDRLVMLREIHFAAAARAEAYESKAAPWLRQAGRCKRTAERMKVLARNVLEAERKVAGYDPTDEAGVPTPYEVVQADGSKIALKLNPPSVVVINVDDLPRRFVSMEPMVLKAEIAKALKAGPVSGAKLSRDLHVSWKR